MDKKDITAGEFAEEGDITLSEPEEEKEFDDGVSASFLRFEDEKEK
ncbi:MAG: hypothetical protein RR632_06515 [Christensenella sp.]